MTEDSRRALEKFISACDEFITCKYLVAENKLQKLLAALAETPPVYELVSECMEQFNRDREIAKAFIQDKKGNNLCSMPTEEFKIIALTFCVLADINNGRINFNDFVRRFFSDEQDVTPFKRFIEVMVLPFRNLISEAFGYPTIDLSKISTETKITPMPAVDQPKTEEIKEEEQEGLFADERIAAKVLQFPTLRNYNRVDSVVGLEKLCLVCQRISSQILEDLENFYKRDPVIEELKSICYALIMAASDMDFDVLRALAIGMKYASKGVKSIKFLVRELLENIEKFYDTFMSY